MDDPFELVVAMFVIALSAVVLVGGQLYLAKQIEPNSGTSAPRPYLAENAARQVSDSTGPKAVALGFGR